ncbi:2433_t:CDS:2 [Paraglomus brasilianum]|uniref:2433_t:CDS:1 n=1 Tax=Paraglomus brasilianum TaxID=144538 RepID=A0A9N8YZX3_9GLOM|nr:2433_t:CDS:2 [Paraglomus brasilianum]
MATISPDNEYLITLPYPPEISPTELLSRKKSGPGLTKTANAFFVYRKAYVKELKRLGKRIKMTQISGVISYSWSREPEKTRSAYKDIADEASEMFKKINPTPEKQPSLTKKEIAQKFSRYQPYPLVYTPAYSYCQSASFEQTMPWGGGELAMFPIEFPTYDTKEQIETFGVEPFFDASSIEQLPSELSSGATTCSPSPSSSPISSNTTYITSDGVQYYTPFENVNNLNNLQYFSAVPAVVPAVSVSQTAYEPNQLLLPYTGDISDSVNYMI